MRSYLAVALLLLAATGHTQSLGDIARQEAERRKKVQGEKGSPTTVVGEDALQKAADQRQHEAGSAEPAKVQTPPATTNSPTDSPKELGAPSASDKDLDRERARRERDEATWRKRASDAEARVQRAQTRYDRVKGLTLTPGEHYVDERGRVVIHSLDQLRRVVADAQAELEAAQRALDELLENARREGVPPGWLR